MPRRFPAADRLPASCLRVLVLLWDAQMEGRPPPSLREMARLLGLNHDTVYRKLLRLREHGLVTWGPLRKRSWQVRCRLEVYL